MRLTISIPEAQTVEAPAVLRLIRLAPDCELQFLHILYRRLSVQGLMTYPDTRGVR